MQRVNLYVADLRPRTEPLVFGHLLLGSAGLVLLLLALTFALWSWLGALQQKVNVQQLRLEQSQGELDALAEILSARRKDPALERELADLGEDIARRKRLVNQVKETLLPLHNGGFAEHLQGLARQSLPEVWLTDIRIERESGQLLLRGAAREPEQIPAYLQRLQGEVAFSGYRMGHFKLLSDKQHSWSRFEVSTNIPSAVIPSAVSP